ncbi:RNA 2'-phosphotransferase [Tepidibacter aestuarii]|uniref:RNA 2'-phosphotransferase n=1 Tax=Tepidibacter aestuarii TaxID=2925782 RepID=UPI0020BE6527|nr:RNA 2'-phosphotransferase [Tepidibacter aestuarii]
MFLCKEISFALRHEPWKYELELAENGWVDIYQLIESLRYDIKWKSLNIKDLEIIIKKLDENRQYIHLSSDIETAI